MDTKQNMDTNPNMNGPNNVDNSKNTRRQSDAYSGLLDRHAVIRGTVLIVACLQIICGVIALGTWSYMLAEGGEWSKQYPLTVGAGIWVGVYAFFPAAFGLVAWTKSMNIVVRMRCFYINFGLAMGLLGVAPQLIRYAIEGTSCGVTKDNLPSVACLFNDEFRNLMFVNIAMGSILVLTAVIVFIYYIYITCVELPKARKAVVAHNRQHGQLNIVD